MSDQLLTSVQAKMPECKSLDVEDDGPGDPLRLLAKVWSERFQEHVFVRCFVTENLLGDVEAVVWALRWALRNAEEERQ